MHRLGIKSSAIVQNAVIDDEVIYCIDTIEIIKRSHWDSLERELRCLKVIKVIRGEQSQN